MKIKIKQNRLLALVTLAVVSVCIVSSVLAATEHGAYATLVFGVGALNEVTVYQYTTSMDEMTGSGLALTNIEFNSSTGNTLWDNATVAGGNDQDETHPIIYVDNTGTTNANINISSSDDPANQDSCLLGRFIYNQSDSGNFRNDVVDPTSPGTGSAGGYINGTMNVTIDSSFTPAEENWGVWLYGNFSDCTEGEDTVTFYINATFA